MLYTTLKLCKENYACASGFKTLKKSLPDSKDTDLIPLTHIVESNGLNDAIWALRATILPCREFITEFAVWCAEQVLYIFEKRYPEDKRVRECIEGVRKYQKGEIQKDELKALRSAAYTAYSAAGAADAAYTATYSAAADAAYTAAYAAGAASATDVKQAQKEKFIEMLNNWENAK